MLPRTTCEVMRLPKQAKKTETKVLKTSFVVVCVYMTCWTPLSVMGFIEVFGGESTRGPPICLLLRILQQPHQPLHIRYHEPAVPANLQKDASNTSQRCVTCLPPCKRQRDEKQRVGWPPD